MTEVGRDLKLIKVISEKIANTISQISVKLK